MVKKLVQDRFLTHVGPKISHDSGTIDKEYWVVVVVGLDRGLQVGHETDFYKATKRTFTRPNDESTTQTCIKKQGESS